MSEQGETPKKGIGSLLKNMFLNDESTTPVPVDAKSKQATASQSVATQQPAPTVAQPAPITGVAVGVVNKDTYNTLMKVLEDRNLPGPDYLELKKAADSMASVIPDESTRYISAFSVLKSSNPKFNKGIVISSIDEYIKYVESERAEAKTELQQIYDTEVGARQKEIQKRAELIEANKKKIDDLNAEILQASQEINTINGEMLAKQTELDIQEKNFNATVDAVVTGLSTDKNKLNAIIVE